MYGNKVITITFGDVAENHAGMQKIGTLANEGYDLNDLSIIYNNFTSANYNCQLYKLNDLYLGHTFDINDMAYLLVIKNGVSVFTNTMNLFNELIHLNWDTKAFMRGKVVNKHARYNLCFANIAQDPNYELGKGRIISYNNTPLLYSIYSQLPYYFGPKANNLYAEGNYYYDKHNCGIGMHGDGERRKVIALRLGSNMPLVYQWYYHSQPVGQKFNIMLEHGDMYIMSQKAVGTDWRSSSKFTLRHGAGCNKYIN